MAQRILANWRKYPKTMSVLLGPSSVEQHVSTLARDEVLREMQRCNAFAVEVHRLRDDWLARRLRPRFNFESHFFSSYCTAIALSEITQVIPRSQGPPSP
jgi:hypothetical protein